MGTSWSGGCDDEWERLVRLHAALVAANLRRPWEQECTLDVLDGRLPPQRAFGRVFG